MRHLPHERLVRVWYVVRVDATSATPVFASRELILGPLGSLCELSVCPMNCA